MNDGQVHTIGSCDTISIAENELCGVRDCGDLAVALAVRAQPEWQHSRFAGIKSGASDLSRLQHSTSVRESGHRCHKLSRRLSDSSAEVRCETAATNSSARGPCAPGYPCRRQRKFDR